MNTFDEMDNLPKERHGCVTAWLILMIIGNAATALILLISAFFKNHYPNMPLSVQIIMALLVIANVLFAVQLFNWKKAGFIGFVITSVVALVINVIIGIQMIQIISGLLGILILYGILQIKKNQKSAWENME